MVGKWEELSRKILFEKYGRGMLEIQYRLPDGREEDFYIKHERDFVRIFAITKDEKVIAVRKFVPGPGRIVVDLPAGYIREGEQVWQTAERELRDETGYKGQLYFVAKTLGDGYTDVTGYVMAARNCEKVLENPPETKTEFLEVVLLPVLEVRKWIKGGSNFSSDIQAWYLGLDYLRLL
jgi:ADP-ribose pyrophosphatase